jgi:hypothetical protein
VSTHRLPYDGAQQTDLFMPSPLTTGHEDEEQKQMKTQNPPEQVSGYTGFI